MTKAELEDKLYWYKATLHYVYDGDTVTAYQLDFGFNIRLIIQRGQGRRIRLLGINAPEKGTKESIKSTAFLKQFEGKEVYLKSYRDKVGKYGGYLFEIYALYKGKYQNINKLLLENNLTKKYKK